MRFLFPSHIAILELDILGDRWSEYASSSFSRNIISPEHETEPLIYQRPDPSSNGPTPSQRSQTSFAPRSRRHQDLRYIATAMEKLEKSRLAYFANKMAVESEPGLTNAQLMLHNFDLKPVEPERRQWGAWNFVGFWISDSFNINTWMISSSPRLWSPTVFLGGSHGSAFGSATLYRLPSSV